MPIDIYHTNLVRHISLPPPNFKNDFCNTFLDVYNLCISVDSKHCIAR